MDKLVIWKTKKLKQIFKRIMTKLKVILSWKILIEREAKLLINGQLESKDHHLQNLV